MVDSDVVVLVIVTISTIGGSVSQLIDAVGVSVTGSAGTVTVVGGGHPVVRVDSDVEGGLDPVDEEEIVSDGSVDEPVDVDPVIDDEDGVSVGSVDEPIEDDPHGAVTVVVVVTFCVQQPPLITFVMFV